MHEIPWHTRCFCPTPALHGSREDPRGSTTALLDQRRADGDTAWQAHVVEVSAFDFRSLVASARREGPGRIREWIVSDLVRTMGRERFARFWRSSLAPDSAYRAETGDELSTWVQGRARHVYGTDVLGPWLPPNARIAGLVVVLLALGVAVGFARERCVA